MPWSPPWGDTTRKHAAGGKTVHVAGGWKASPAVVLKEHNGARHDGAAASFATQDKRADVLYAGFGGGAVAASSAAGIHP